MVTRRQILIAVRSFQSWVSAEQVFEALPVASRSTVAATQDILDRMVRDRVLTTDRPVPPMRYCVRPPKQRPSAPLELTYPGLAALESAGLGSGFLLGTAISLATSKFLASKEARIFQLLSRWVERAKVGLEPPVSDAVMKILLDLQSKTLHLGIRAEIDRIREVYEGRFPMPVAPVLRYDAVEFARHVTTAVNENNASFIPSWIFQHTPGIEEQVLALFTACRGSLEFSKRFLVRCAVHVAHTELRMKQHVIAANLLLRVENVRAILDDLGSGGSLCDRGDARDHQMRIVGALRPLAYTEPAIDLVCTLRAVHALQGNLTHSARYIGITRAALDRLISRYGLERLRGGVYGDCLL